MRNGELQCIMELPQYSDRGSLVPVDNANIQTLLEALVAKNVCCAVSMSSSVVVYEYR